MKSAFKRIAVLIGIFAMICGILPMPFGVFNTGVLTLILFGLALCALAVLWDAFPAVESAPRIHRSLSVGAARPAPVRAARWWRWLRLVVSFVLAAAVLTGAVLSVLMIRYAWFMPPRAGESYTVVVLGSQSVNGKPSQILRLRLDAAYTYLAAHSDTPVVVTGGVDRGETISEAVAMRDYLIARGLPAGRIYMEDQSRNTLENLRFAGELITHEDLPRQLLIVTDGFHQLRGAIYAQAVGLKPCAAVSSTTPWGLLPSYWVRECMALLRALVLQGNSLP